MGELDTRPFFEALKKKYRKNEVEDRVLEMCSLWEEHLTKPDWHPFKVIIAEGKEKVTVKHIDLLKLSLESTCFIACHTSSNLVHSVIYLRAYKYFDGLHTLD